MHAEVDRFYVKPARGSAGDGVCIARGVDGIIDAARDVLEEVRLPARLHRPELGAACLLGAPVLVLPWRRAERTSTATATGPPALQGTPPSCSLSLRCCAPRLVHHVVQSTSPLTLLLMHPTALQGVHGEELVVEAQVAGAREDNTAGGVRFSVTVLQTAAGPLALPPTEHGCYDVEVDIRESFLDLHRAIYRQKARPPRRACHSQLSSGSAALLSASRACVVSTATASGRVSLLKHVVW